jgi:hypothetical protein
MNVMKLTRPRLSAHTKPVEGRWAAWAMVVLGSVLAGGCISVNAPDRPIVIELNINIKQEVIYRLAQDAGSTIDQNPDIF